MEKTTFDYAQFVNALCKPGEQILRELTPSDCHLLHMAMLHASEAAELLDAVKKAVIYRKPIDRINVKEELGDSEFALQALRTHFGWSREEILEDNKQKLMVRYKGLTYSNTAAIERADKCTGEVDDAGRL